MLPPKIVPTAFRVRHQSRSRTRASRKSSAMYVIRAPVPRYAGKRLNFHRSIREANDSDIRWSSGFSRCRVRDPDDERDGGDDVDHRVDDQIAALVLQQRRGVAEEHGDGNGERVSEQIFPQHKTN